MEALEGDQCSAQRCVLPVYFPGGFTITSIVVDPPERKLTNAPLRTVSIVVITSDESEPSWLEP